MTDPCFNISETYFPRNVTRQTNLPTTDFNVIALAPWIDANCTRSFLQSAQLDPIRAFIFYVPDNGTSQPPNPNSPVWNMHDGGQWKLKSTFPVYAIPGHVGNQLMTQLSFYSGNLTAVPNGYDLLWIYQRNLSDYVRIYTEMNIDVSTSLPGLWVFLLVVIGGILCTLGLTSLLMHYIQRRRRNLLQRRVERGEVDLEAIGIKRLKVPKEHIEKMPVYIYKCEEVINGTNGPAEKRMSVPISSAKNGTQLSVALSRPKSAAGNVHCADAPTASTGESQSSSSSIASHVYRPHSQSSCPICLEDFEPGITAVRELPCGHIFHPECIDSFLVNNSSLCPMCKKSVLPRGYCAVAITNGMVRRERAIRRLRSRVVVHEDNPSVDAQAGWRHPVSFLRSATRRVFSRSSGVSASGMRSPSGPPPLIPLQNQHQRSAVSFSQSQRQLDYGPPRREFAQHRAGEPLGSDDQDTNEMQL